MKFGIFGIGSGACADPEVALAVAQAAEQAGFDSVWTGEHVVVPDPQVPPSPIAPTVPMLHPSTVLSFLAAGTSRVKLGTGIILVPQRNPLVLAKELASLDVLSGGRLLFGIGVGYLRPEFEALGVDFEGRGRRTDEYIEAMLAIWTQEKPAYAGRFVNFSGVQAYPRPVQKPHPPIIVGGMSASAYRRAITRGNGWYGFALDVEKTRGCIQGLSEAQKLHERPAALGPLEISVTPSVPLDADTVKAFEDLGVHRLVSIGRGQSKQKLVAFVEGMGAELI